MDKAEKYSVAISSVALIVSIVTLVLTSPLIIDYIRRPIFEITSTHRMVFDDRFVSWFQVTNTGGSSSRGIVLKVMCLAGDNITFPQYGLTSVELRKAADISTNSPVDIQERVYEIGELHPNRPIWLVIGSKKIDIDLYKAYRQAQRDRFSLRLPTISSVVAGDAEIKIAQRRVEPAQMMQIPGMEPPREIDRSEW